MNTNKLHFMKVVLESVPVLSALSYIDYNIFNDTEKVLFNANLQL